ncbi:hypothetical protein C4D60_Mb07t19190 [Musa balbisiana]|uniref:non-specific serine/threonine protein kinase n=1 Tax=Musa balbisiana TaxID=52838 RepID=A0A4S8JGN3_MUSBA|nr:hypothetical protein C4D60_Mb07t19190 [Musa balbisiana]
MVAAASRDDSDHDSSCSSFSTALDSRRSWISDVSFGSSSSISVRSYCGANGGDGAGHHQQQLLKPHKANQAEWEAIRRLRAASGHVRLDHFRILRRLGSGDLGNVYLCQLRDPRSPGCLYAMKVVDREALAFRKKLQRAETEKEILRSLDHPFLPTLYADFDAAHYSCLVMEFCPGGDLHVARQRQPGRRFSISTANSSCVPPIQPVLSCFYGGGGGGGSNANKCNKKAKTEDDDDDDADDQELDPELVAEPIAARSKSFVGTHEYLAPEVISGAGHGSAVDWWALGVFIYEMIYGRTPFKGEDNEKTLINIIKQPLGFPKAAAAAAAGKELEELSRAQDLICKLLVKNPKKRIGSMKGSAEIKKHEFFKGVNWALIRSVRPPEVPRDSRTGRSRTPAVAQKLSKKARDEPYHIPHHIDYF